MADALGHKWGQIVGELLERANKQLLMTVAKGYGFYCDSKGPRAARSGKKVSWRDKFGNTHDLDYVFEKGGTEDVAEAVKYIKGLKARIGAFEAAKNSILQNSVQTPYEFQAIINKHFWELI